MNRLTLPARKRLALGLLSTSLIALASTSLTACAPLVLGGAAAGALVATDRRTSGMQVEDKGIQIKAGNRLREALGDRGHINVNAYNRTVLLTGEVPTEADRTAAEQAVARVENVAHVSNQLIVSLNSTLASRSNDVLVATKVRATLVDARDLMSNAFDIVVERGEVYLMGIVTEREANRAAELTASIPGVKRVVKVFEVISEAELANKLPRPVPAGAGAASGSATQ
jgi:osmotically-inducible protein OsmY